MVPHSRSKGAAETVNSVSRRVNLPADFLPTSPLIRLLTKGGLVVMQEATPWVTLEEKTAFEDNGFHILRGALSQGETAVCRNVLANMLLLPESHPYSGRLAATDITPTPPDNPRAVWAGFDLQLFDDLFWDLAFQPRIALTVDALIGPDINLYETSCVTKMAGFPADFRDWHQDSEYSDPQTNDRNVTVIVFLDDMNGESGATWVVPGTHKLGPLPHNLPGEKLTSAAMEVTDKHLYAPQGVSFDFKAGDALIFLVRLIHKSGPNRSDSSRWSVALNYTRRDTQDIGKINHFVGAYLPIVRNGKLYDFTRRWKPESERETR